MEKTIITHTITPTMKNEILTEASRRKLFLSPEALEILDSNGYSLEFVNTVLNSLQGSQMFVSKNDVINFLNGDKGLFKPEKTVKPPVPKNCDIEILQDSDITGNSTCTGTIEDFTGYFRNRFNTLKKILLHRRDFEPPVSLEKALELRRECNVVGMVFDTNKTKNGHTIIQLEDEKTTISVFIGKDSPLNEELFVTDEVIGVRGKVTNNGGLFIANEIFRPDIPQNHKWTQTDQESTIAFLSDIHVGSKEFLKPNWNKMVTWLKENYREQQINYIIMPGDVVDGIGAYPDQEFDLELLDIFDQYHALSEYVKEIPDDIRIIVHPGNHDACRLAEPQPALAEIYTKEFDSNVTMTGNPINVKIEGRLITSYHGKSIDDWVSAIRGMSYDDPLAVMKEMCRRRHLAPMYGKRNALAPEKKDYLCLDAVPDIFVSGHVHGAGCMEYRGVKLINASTWQAQTDYQKKHNFNPNPGIMPTVNLKTGRIKMMNF